MPEKKTSTLIEKAAAGDARAAAELVGVVYVDKIHAAIYKFYPRYLQADYREQRDDLASEILMHLITPDSKGNWRLRNLNAAGNFEGYFYRMALHFLIDRHDKMKRRGEIDVDFEEGRVPDEDREDPDGIFDGDTDVPDDDAGAPRSTEAPEDDEEESGEEDMHILDDMPVGSVEVYDDVDRQHMAIIDILNASVRTSPRDRYLLSTRLLAIIVKPSGEVLNLQENIDATLGNVSDEPQNKSIYPPFNKFKAAATRYVYGDEKPQKSTKKKGRKKEGDKEN